MEDTASKSVNKRKSLEAIRLAIESVLGSIDNCFNAEETVKYAEAVKILAEAFREVKQS